MRTNTLYQVTLLDTLAAWTLALLWLLPLAYAVWTAFHHAEYATRFDLLAPWTLENFRRAYLAGVKMVFGTDAGIYPHGDNARQFAWMVRYGMTPTEAIRTATLNAAEALGRADLGVLEAGRVADVIAVAGDPTRDVTLLESVPFVMKGGQVSKQAGR